MEIIDERGELCAWCSDDPQDFIHIPPVEAIRLLTLKYIEQCGVSQGMCTLYYKAAEAWQEILATTLNHPLAKPVKELPLYQLMPLICEEYKPELYADYDIVDLIGDELLALYEEAEKVCDKQTGEALEMLVWNIRFEKCIELLYQKACEYHAKGELTIATRYYKQAADYGNVKAMLVLGDCFITGKGVEVDYEKGVMWLKKAADCGSEEASIVLDK